jgi:hypothetical protein
MDKIVFVDYQTKICSAFLNAVSDTVWDALGQAKTPSEARQFIGAVGEAPLDGKAYLRASADWLEAATALMHNQLGGRSDADAHPTSAITGLDTALAGKAPVVHTHTGSQITGITATQVSFSPVGTIAAATVQAAIAELDSETQTSLSGKAPTSAATAVGTSFTPAGTIAATNVQTAIQELDSETQTALGLKANTSSVVAKTSNTGSALLPAGTDAQRDAVPAVGAIRFSSTATGWEGWNGTNWVSIGGGQMYGSALVKGIFYNNTNIAENVTIKSGTNGGTFGPVTIDNGFTVTVESGSVWSIT